MNGDERTTTEVTAAIQADNDRLYLKWQQAEARYTSTRTPEEGGSRFSHDLAKSAELAALRAFVSHSEAHNLSTRGF